MTENNLKLIREPTANGVQVTSPFKQAEPKNDSKKCSCVKHGSRGSLESRRKLSMQQIWSLHRHQIPVVDDSSAFYAVLPKNGTVQMASLAYWDDVVGPKVRHIWSQSGNPADMPVSFCQMMRAVKYAMNHSLSGVLNTPNKDLICNKLFVVEEEGVVILSVVFKAVVDGANKLHSLSVIVPQKMLEFYMHVHQVCVRWAVTFVDIMKRSMDHKSLKSKLMESVHQLAIIILKIERSGLTSHDLQVLNFERLERFSDHFLESVVETHLHHYGPTVVTGSSKKEVNAMVILLAHFLSTFEQRTCCLVSDADRSKFMPGLAVQGLLKDQHGKIDISTEDMSWSSHPVCLIDLDFEMVRTSRGHRIGVSSRGKASKSRTRDNDNTKSVFNLLKSKGTLVPTLIYEVRALEMNNKHMIIRQFCHQLKYKACLLIKVFDKCRKDDTFFKQLNRSTKLLYNLVTVDTCADFKIILTVADKMKPGFALAVNDVHFKT